MNNILKGDDILFLQKILWIIFCQKNTLYKGMHAPYWPSAIRIQPVPPYTDFVQPNKYQSLRYYTDSVHSLITPQRTTQPTGSSYIQCPAGRVFQYWVGSGRVLDKIPGIGSGSGRVGVSKYTIGYFRVSFLLSGISGYVGYFQVFLGLPMYILIGLFSNIWWGLKRLQQNQTGFR